LQLSSTWLPQISGAPGCTAGFVSSQSLHQGTPSPSASALSAALPSSQRTKLCKYCARFWATSWKAASADADWGGRRHFFRSQLRLADRPAAS
jgi:hypothetical protein